MRLWRRFSDWAPCSPRIFGVFDFGFLTSLLFIFVPHSRSWSGPLLRYRRSRKFSAARCSAQWRGIRNGRFSSFYHDAHDNSDSLFMTSQYPLFLFSSALFLHRSWLDCFLFFYTFIRILIIFSLLFVYPRQSTNLRRVLRNDLVVFIDPTGFNSRISSFDCLSHLH